MAFTVYGKHWRKKWRIVTISFFTNEVVQQSRNAWEDEALRVITDIQAHPSAATTGAEIRTSLQLLMYNVIYCLMFDSRFESESDLLFLKLKALNNQRSQHAQSFDYNYGDFIPVLHPFLRGYLKKCQDIQYRRMALFKESFLEKREQLLATKPDGPKAAIDHIVITIRTKFSKKNTRQFHYHALSLIQLVVFLTIIHHISLLFNLHDLLTLTINEYHKCKKQLQYGIASNPPRLFIPKDSEKKARLTKTTSCALSRTSTSRQSKQSSGPWNGPELVNNPAIQSGIREELTVNLSKGNVITESDIYNNKIPYLTAFVKEVMRLHMAIPLLVPQPSEACRLRHPCREQDPREREVDCE